MNRLEHRLAQYDRMKNGYQRGDIVKSLEDDTYGEIGKVTEVPRGGIHHYVCGGNYTVDGVGILLGDYMELIYPVDGGKY
jgi:hypothetical protein